MKKNKMKWAVKKSTKIKHHAEVRRPIPELLNIEFAGPVAY